MTLEEDIHPSLSLPDFCPVPVCFNVRERAFRAVDAHPNLIVFTTLDDNHRLREAGAGGSNPLTPTNTFIYLHQVSLENNQPFQDRKSTISPAVNAELPRYRRIGNFWDSMSICASIFFRIPNPSEKNLRGSPGMLRQLAWCKYGLRSVLT